MNGKQGSRGEARGWLLRSCLGALVLGALASARVSAQCTSLTPAQMFLDPATIAEDDYPVVTLGGPGTVTFLNGGDPVVGLAIAPPTMLSPADDYIPGVDYAACIDAAAGTGEIDFVSDGSYAVRVDRMSGSQTIEIYDLGVRDLGTCYKKGNLKEFPCQTPSDTFAGDDVDIAPEIKVTSIADLVTKVCNKAGTGMIDLFLIDHGCEGSITINGNEKISLTDKANLNAFCNGVKSKVKSVTFLSCSTGHGKAGCDFLAGVSKCLGNKPVCGYSGNVKSWVRNGMMHWGSYGDKVKKEATPAVEKKLCQESSIRPLSYDLRQGRVSFQAPQKRAFGAFCYVNTDASCSYVVPAENGGETLIDWGVLGGTAGTQCLGLSDIVTSFDFAYGTAAQDPGIGGPGASMTLTFYTDYEGFGGDSGNCPVATFAFSGLPGYSGSSSGGSAGFAVSLDLVGGFEFQLPDGKLGFGFSDPSEGTVCVGSADTGPIQCLSGDGFGGPDPATGQLDELDAWAPDTKGNYLGVLGTSPDLGSFFLRIARADLSATPAAVAFRNAAPNKPDSLTCSPPVLGGVLDMEMLAPPGYLLGFFFGFDTPFALTLGGGQVLLCLDLGGNGELLAGGSLMGTPAPPVGGCPAFTASLPMPLDVTLCGFTFCVQGLCAFGVTPFALTSACDLTVGG